MPPRRRYTLSFLLFLLAGALMIGVPTSASARTTFQASIGPDGGNGAHSANYVGASFDGSRVFFETTESLVAADNESGNQVDVYERRGGITTLLSVSDTAGNGAHDAQFVGKSRDGTHVFFQTREQLVPEDTDGGYLDVYERANGATTLVSAGGNGPYDATRAGGALGGVTPPASDDGSRFFFETQEPLAANDVEGSAHVDVYEGSGGTSTLISTGPGTGSTAFDAFFDGIDTSGQRVFFHTNEKLIAGVDTDSQQDIFMREGPSTTLVSTGPNGGNGPFPASFSGPGSFASGSVQGSISSNGQFVWFQTAERLNTTSDTDVAQDVYRRTTVGAPGTILISTGSSADPAYFKGASLDGQGAAFITQESLTVQDSDLGRWDAYGWLSGSTALLSVGPLNSAIDVELDAGAAADGGLPFFFETRERLLPADDTDNQVDVYQGTLNIFTVQLQLASRGPDGGNGPFDARLANGLDDSDVTADGQHVFFETAERLDTTADQDSELDIYERDVPTGTASLMSTGPNAVAGTNIAPSFGAIARNGSRAYFETIERLVGGDTDNSADLYSADSAVDTASEPAVPPGGSTSTNTEPSPSDPLGTTVTTPEGGSVTISEHPSNGAPSGFTGLGWQADITVDPPATDPANPLVLRFRADASILPADLSTVKIFKDGVEVPACTGPPGHASPDPCVSSMTLLGDGDGQATVLTTSASGWVLAIENGSIEIVKDAEPNDPQDFDFSTGGLLPSESFVLDDDPDSASPSNSKTFSGLTPGNGYAVAETEPSGWDQAGATCDNGSAPDNIRVDAGETVTCTFTNIPRPGLPASASPIEVSLVPVFEQCITGANGEHAPPLSGPSCDATPSSSIARVGSDNAGSVQLAASPGDVAISITDSDIQTPAGADYDPNPSGTPDLHEVAKFRLTDRGNCAPSSCSGPYGQRGTATEVDFGPVPIECTPSGDSGSAPGSDCNVATSANTVTPGSIVSGRQTVVQVFRVRVTDAEGALFQQQGIYAP